MNFIVNGKWQQQDFYVVKSPKIEFLIDIRALIMQRIMEPICCVIKEESCHDTMPDCKAPLGSPLYSDDFIVFKDTILGRNLYTVWSNEGNITKVLADRSVIPCLMPHIVLREVVDPQEMPKITWGI